MLSGRADPEVLSRGCPRLSALDVSELTLEEVETLQVLYEFRSRTAEDLLPPALHPTVPGVVSCMVQRFPASPWGELRMAQARIQCRSGARPRAFLLRAVTDNESAAAALGERWGYHIEPGSVRWRRGYDEVRAEVMGRDGPILAVALRDAVRVEPHIVQYVAGMHLAETPRGLRLVQVDPELEAARAERGKPRLDAFWGEAWGAPGLVPLYPISASVTVGTVTLPRLRYLCKPDVWAFDGTERL